MKSKSFIVCLFSFLLFNSCSSQTASVKNLNSDEFEKGIAKPGIQLVDVRTMEEYKDKHIANSKLININDAAFETTINSLDKSKPLYLYCLSGGRSSKAGSFAVKNDFKEVYNLDGGITAWLGNKKPVETSSGGDSSGGMSFDDYLKLLNKPGKLVLVDFSAVWCGPCKLLKPTVDKVVKNNGDKVELLSIDVDKNSNVSGTMNIKGIPLLILYKQGKEVWRNLGLIDENDLEKKIKEFTK